MSEVIPTDAELLAQLDDLRHTADTWNAEHRDTIQRYKRYAGLLSFFSVTAFIGVSVLIALPTYTRQPVEPIPAGLALFNLGAILGVWLYIVVGLIQLVTSAARLAQFTEMVRHTRELVNLHTVNATVLEALITALVQAATRQPITDPKDQAVWDIISKDRSLTDDQVSARIANKELGFTLGREAVSNRRNKLIGMGWPAKRQV